MRRRRIPGRGMEVSLNTFPGIRGGRGVDWEGDASAFLGGWKMGLICVTCSDNEPGRPEV